MEKFTKKEKEEVYRFIKLVLVVIVLLFFMCLALGYIASRLPVDTRGDPFQP